jgi:hypothetical protein
MWLVQKEIENKVVDVLSRIEHEKGKSEILVLQVDV